MAKNQTMLAVQDVLAGMPISTAASKHGINRTTISRHMKQNNITKPSKVKKVQPDSTVIQKRSKRSFNNINIVLLSELILEQKTVDEIAHQMQVPVEELSEYIKDHGFQAYRARRILSELSYRSKGYWLMGAWIAEGQLNERDVTESH
jgi:hypothetical protein